MRIPGVVHADDLLKDWPRSGFPDGRMALSRPEPFYSIRERLRVTWMVFTGRADAILWTDQ